MTSLPWNLRTLGGERSDLLRLEPQKVRAAILAIVERLFEPKVASPLADGIARLTSEALLRFATWVEVHVPDDSEIIAPRDSFEHNDRTMAKRRIPAHARETLVPLSDLARLSPP